MFGKFERKPEMPANSAAEVPEGKTEAEISMEARIERAQNNYAVIKQFNDDQEVNKDEYEALRQASNTLAEDLKSISYYLRKENGLPWSPLEEMQKRVQTDTVVANGA